MAICNVWWSMQCPYSPGRIYTKYAYMRKYLCMHLYNCFDYWCVIADAYLVCESIYAPLIVWLLTWCVNADRNSSDVVQDWGEIQLDCSVPNAMTVYYSKNLRLPDYIVGEIYEHNLIKLSVECNNKVCQKLNEPIICQTQHYHFDRMRV